MSKNRKGDQRPLFVRMTREERTKLQNKQKAKGYRTLAEYVRQDLLREELIEHK